MDPLQTCLPDDAVAHSLPGTRPCAPGDWLRIDDAFAGQMALRDSLVLARPGDVMACLPEGAAPAAELLDAVLSDLPALGHRVASNSVIRPDGVAVTLDPEAPLAVLGRLVQEDFAVMLPGPEGHRMVAGIVCFPSRWRLEQKIGRPLVRIHRPVPAYDAALARRVQRLFDGVRAGAPLVRWNRLPYWERRLFNPRPEEAPRAPEGPRPYVRVERQVMRRLPETAAVVFSIHTWLVRTDTVPPYSAGCARSGVAGD